MDTAVDSGQEVVVKLIDVVPYAGAVAVMLIIVLGFIIWMMILWGKREKSQNKLIDMLIDIISHNAEMTGSHTATLNNMMTLCHYKNRGDDSDEAEPI